MSRAEAISRALLMLVVLKIAIDPYAHLREHRAPD
jgi:hypothetical protein